jgi:hypothetical protein
MLPWSASRQVGRCEPLRLFGETPEASASGGPTLISPGAGPSRYPCRRAATVPLGRRQRTGPRVSNTGVDTVRTLAQQRHFFTSEIELTGFGRVLLIGDEEAVERIRELISVDGTHDLVDITDEPNDGT